MCCTSGRRSRPNSLQSVIQQRSSSHEYHSHQDTRGRDRRRVRRRFLSKRWRGCSPRHSRKNRRRRRRRRYGGSEPSRDRLDLSPESGLFGLRMWSARLVDAALCQSPSMVPDSRCSQAESVCQSLHKSCIQRYLKRCSAGIPRTSHLPNHLPGHSVPEPPTCPEARCLRGCRWA